MFSSLLRRPRPAKRRVSSGRDLASSGLLDPNDISPAFTPRRATADFTEADDDDDDRTEEEESNPERHDDNDPEDEDEDEDEDDEDGERGALPVLPLFSATHLDSLAVYNITHSIRIIVTARTETSLTWEQLRSPQVSQFLVKPMQQQIRQQHFNRATLYALMANSLQFSKEGQRFPANAGTSNTRSRVCELLALKLLKEYTTRELIDALAYDFYPLQGIPGAQPMAMISPKAKNSLTASRTSTLEVAIRAQAKHFLAHPVVTQQLEAIWSGAITFYSSADTLHRTAPTSNGNGTKVDDRTPLLGSAHHKEGHPQVPPGRRTVLLYDPRQASMLKLSRLRVPRYRSFLSTISLAILIGLFLAVLVERSEKITGLELVFWFWSAGFMLDELVGFNEQGFALYIMSFWNIFDLGILALFIAYYCMRAYGVFLIDPHHWHDLAYDVLAANAILLLPRIFNVLDHYQYFSQLLIAFRLMAVDLVAVFTLILVLCSGFFVFFTLSNNAGDASQVAYQIFQLLMGFTPAAWDAWPNYNWLARGLLVLFLFICHFLVVTILITVLTNSFMAIASNANEEHQFLFAINTISMVKNDALFSYIAPSNIFAWLLIPLRYCMPLKDFVWLNRAIIKITHFPVLFCIYLYEKFWLAPSMYEPTDLVENPGRGRQRIVSFADPASRIISSPGVRVREESVAGFHKDRALEEVFRRIPGPAGMRTQRRHERHKTQTAIRNWMDQADDDAASGSNWPTLDSRAMPEWQRKLSAGRDRPSRLISDVRSVASDPADLVSNYGSAMPQRFSRPSRVSLVPDDKDHQQTDADGDDELVTNDEDEDDQRTHEERSHRGGKERIEEEDYFGNVPVSARIAQLASSHSSSGRNIPVTPRQRKGLHSRTLSTNTILYNPEDLKKSSGSSSASPGKGAQAPTRTSGRSSGGHSGAPSGGQTPGRRTSPRRAALGANAKSRPVLPSRGITETGGISRSALLSIEPRNRPGGARRLSSVDLSAFPDPLDMPFVAGDPTHDMAGSFQTQMAMAMMKNNQLRGTGGADGGDRDRMGRLVLARMKTLEESFGEIIREMRDLKSSSTVTSSRRNSSDERTSQAPIKHISGNVTPKKATGMRPVSRKSMKPKMEQPKKDVKGKGKEPEYSTDDEGDGGNSVSKLGGSL